MNKYETITCPDCGSIVTRIIRWIPVEEGLPEKETTDLGEEVLVILEYPYSRVAPVSFVHGKFCTGHYGCTTDWTRYVTHWMPLPEGRTE